MASEKKATDSYKNVLTSAASLAASAMLARTLVNEFLPSELRDYVFSGIDQLRSRLSSEHTIIIDQNEGYASNQIYDDAKTYLSTRINPPSLRRLRVSRLDDAKTTVISLEDGEEMIDVYRGVEFKWQLVCREVESSSSGSGSGSNSRRSEFRSIEVKFHQKHKDMALHSYLQFIQSEAKTIKEDNRVLQLYMNDMDSWSPINLRHPSTFDTLAMDLELKEEVMNDLARFVKRKDYHRRIGKAWKRGYLLYGPPGTGKSSLIAAMANYLKFDIYDLELTEVKWNSYLRRLLVGMSNRSILVIEDIDCSLQMPSREEKEETGGSSEDGKLTLSGLLNFVDGLWSASGEERIIIFTTNYKDRLDAALLRPGRMDMHIHMSYCTPYAFRVLASNYHAVDEHELFPEIEGLIREARATQADVAGELMKSDDTDDALQKLIKFLQEKRKQSNYQGETVCQPRRKKEKAQIVVHEVRSLQKDETE